MLYEVITLSMLPLVPVLTLLLIVIPAYLLYPVRRARVPSGLSSGVSGS